MTPAISAGGQIDIDGGGTYVGCRITAIAACEAICPCSTNEGIITTCANEGIIAGSTIQNVIFSITSYNIVGSRTCYPLDIMQLIAFGLSARMNACAQVHGDCGRADI